MNNINELIHEDQMDENVIISNIMDYVGLETDDYSGIVRDSDTLEPFIINGKLLKYAEDDYVPIDHNTEMFFNPLKNYNIARNTFMYMLYKLEKNGTFYSPVYDIEYSKEDNRQKRLVLFNENYDKMFTQFYYNTNFIFIEIIYKLLGDNTVFNQIDNPY